jgi:hypothetical protein
MLGESLNETWRFEWENTYIYTVYIHIYINSGVP